MSVQKHHTGLAPPSRTRRQNHSCDQCRKSKRACDAVNGQRSPCSYCARTRKRCTMDWARSRGQSVVKQGQFERLLFPYMFEESEAQGLGPWDGLGFGGMDSASGVMGWELDGTGGGLEGGLLNYDLMPLGLGVADETQGVQPGISDTLLSSDCLSDLLLPDLSSARTSDISTQQGADLLDPVYQQTTPTSQASSTYVNLYDPSPEDTQRSTSAWMNPFDQPSQSQSLSPRYTPPSLSPFSIDQQLITKSNNHLTSANLLQIYHDVLEHNLSCWLTETTCPYQPPPQTTTNLQAVVPEWGSSWSNRIYQRTIKLDRVAQSCKLLQLTSLEDKAASKALHLSIMAFATQWAQGSQRHRERYQSTPSLSHVGAGDNMGDGIAEFDRALQNHFWDQARRALQDVADVESYRVACAELIFGMAQRPWSADGDSHRQNSEEEDDGGFAAESALSRVRDIMRNEGPPVYMERAARKMHALKYRCDALERGLGLGGRRANREKDAHSIAAMSAEDRATIGLLYWLAIMFDTVSSSMNERPVVILDEECQHEAQRPSQTQTQTQTRWDLDLFVPGGLDAQHQTHWPCTYEAAAEDVIKSAPVKVLLFRHISYLQNAIRKGAHAAQVEDIIRSTTALYEYWHKTHGAFFSELIQDFAAVPQRVQGWFVCISAHWHLAALMLADLLEFVDENGLGMEDEACERVAGAVGSGIRKNSAAELADLARVATPASTSDSGLGIGMRMGMGMGMGMDMGGPQMPDFHHAVNEGTLLTEPWTIIMIRAFAKACVIFLGEAEGFAQCSGIGSGYGTADFERRIDQAQDCIKGLWLLGKKSDMARKIAETLSLALLKLRSSCD
ncbi:hypothetical protein BJX76DRAFT_363962 [Aspergillus varians]